MEAANRGAHDEGERNDRAQHRAAARAGCPIPTSRPDLSFQFHYFALRKMHFLLRARAVAVFPGGFGTFDEMFELLTLIQTGKMRPLPILLFGREFWNRVVNFEAMVEEGVIAPHDLDLIHWSEEAREAWDFVKRFYEEHPDAAPRSRGRRSRTGAQNLVRFRGAARSSGWPPAAARVEPGSLSAFCGPLLRPVPALRRRGAAAAAGAAGSGFGACCAR